PTPQHGGPMYLPYACVRPVHTPQTSMPVGVAEHAHSTPQEPTPRRAFVALEQSALMSPDGPSNSENAPPAALRGISIESPCVSSDHSMAGSQLVSATMSSLDFDTVIVAPL